MVGRCGMRWFGDRLVWNPAVDSARNPAVDAGKVISCHLEIGIRHGIRQLVPERRFLAIRRSESGMGSGSGCRKGEVTRCDGQNPAWDPAAGAGNVPWRSSAPTGLARPTHSQCLIPEHMPLWRRATRRLFAWHTTIVSFRMGPGSPVYVELAIKLNTSRDGEVRFVVLHVYQLRELALHRSASRDAWLAACAEGP